MSVIEQTITLKFPGCCAECEYYHQDYSNTPDSGEDWDIYCDMDTDGDLGAKIDCAWDRPPNECPLMVIADIFKIEIPKAEIPPEYREGYDERVKRQQAEINKEWEIKI